MACMSECLLYLERLEVKPKNNNKNIINNNSNDDENNYNDDVSVTLSADIQVRQKRIDVY